MPIFNELIEGSKLVMVNQCGHAPMMEHPADFNQILEDFLNRVENVGEMSAHSA